VNPKPHKWGRKNNPETPKQKKKTPQKKRDPQGSPPHRTTTHATPNKEKKRKAKPRESGRKGRGYGPPPNPPPQPQKHNHHNSLPVRAGSSKALSQEPPSS